MSLYGALQKMVSIYYLLLNEKANLTNCKVSTSYISRSTNFERVKRYTIP